MKRGKVKETAVQHVEANVSYNVAALVLTVLKASPCTARQIRLLKNRINEQSTKFCLSLQILCNVTNCININIIIILIYNVQIKIIIIIVRRRLVKRDHDDLVCRVLNLSCYTGRRGVDIAKLVLAHERRLGPD